jgi:hypothetical protein
VVHEPDEPPWVIERDTEDLVRLDELMARRFPHLHECMITLPQLTEADITQDSHTELARLDRQVQLYINDLIVTDLPGKAFEDVLAAFLSHGKAFSELVTAETVREKEESDIFNLKLLDAASDILVSARQSTGRIVDGISDSTGRVVDGISEIKPFTALSSSLSSLWLDQRPDPLLPESQPPDATSPSEPAAALAASLGSAGGHTASIEEVAAAAMRRADGGAVAEAVDGGGEMAACEMEEQRAKLAGAGGLTFHDSS